MKTPIRFLLSFLALALSAGAATAHVSLASPNAQAGAPYELVLRIGHGCEASPTTALSVRLPAGFGAAVPQPKARWSVQAKAGVVTWTASSKESALPASEKGEFVLTTKAPRAAGPAWLKVLQTCEQGSQDWADVPAQGTSTAGMKTPAVLVSVLAPREFAQAKMLPRVENAWVRSSVAGQSGTGAFMRITANEPLQLVGASTPVAGSAEVHEMKMEGDVMRMRPIGKLDLPAGQPVDLGSGGYHVMLTDLKQALQNDTVVPLTLLFRNAAGVQARMELQLPVKAQAPAGAAVPTHKH